MPVCASEGTAHLVVSCTTGLVELVVFDEFRRVDASSTQLLVYEALSYGSTGTQGGIQTGGGRVLEEILGSHSKNIGSPAVFAAIVECVMFAAAEISYQYMRLSANSI